MNTAQQLLASTLAGHERFRWTAGMTGVQYFGQDRTPLKWTAKTDQIAPGYAIPDLQCPATAGCLWVQVIESAGDLAWWDEMDTIGGAGMTAGKLLYRLWWGEPWEG